ncbi:HIRAN domain-containing protein [Paracoccus tibetensis]|uniref:HIRAN domain-containing protein n=1 Tax=Paracoccus tibetensis TaxID=336292 RepID=A0A1G5FP32_9RHOB|nr:HIRAN domain-containing protein [Paracoccus tibetensis]SCY40993.1 HIRAN domain-containing protein [Paracoccus tibetensis]
MIGRRQVLGTLALAGVPAAAVLPSAALARGRAEPVEVLTTHLANPDRSFRPTPGQRLVLRRDPSRAFDPAAIAVETEAGQRVGVVPPARAAVLSRLMDQGAPAHAEAAPGGRLRVFLTLG